MLRHPGFVSRPPRRAPPLLVAILSALLVAGCATTHSSASMRPDTVTGDPASDMAADLLIVRPLGLVGTVIGAAGFVLSLPFTLPTGSAGNAAHELVRKPFEYTFDRPLGDFDRCGAERVPCGRR